MVQYYCSIVILCQRFNTSLENLWWWEHILQRFKDSFHFESLNTTEQTVACSYIPAVILQMHRGGCCFVLNGKTVSTFIELEITPCSCMPQPSTSVRSYIKYTVKTLVELKKIIKCIFWCNGSYNMNMYDFRESFPVRNMLSPHKRLLLQSSTEG